MPVVVDPDPMVLDTLLAGLPVGSHGLPTLERLPAWLGSHADEYAVVVGPTVDDTVAVAACAQVRALAPAISTVIAREHLDGDLLGAAMKAGARDVVHHGDTASVAAAVERAHELFLALRGAGGPGGGAPVGRVVSVFSPKGGVGKTTLAVNLALALSDHGARRVCLVDLDLAFGDVAITMQLFPSRTIEQAIGSEDSMDAEVLGELLTRHADALMVLAAPAHPDVRERISPLLVARLLRGLRESFDHVVVDLAPAFDEQTLTALDETDEVVLVATLDVPTLKNVKVALDTFDALDVARDRRRLVLNRADDEVGISPDKVEGILGMPIDVQIGSSLDVAASTNSGNPLVTSDPGHQLSRAVRLLAESIAGPSAATAGAPPAPDQRRRRLSRRRAQR